MGVLALYASFRGSTYLLERASFHINVRSSNGAKCLAFDRTLCRLCAYQERACSPPGHVKQLTECHRRIHLRILQ